MKPSKEEIRKLILDYLSKNKRMSLATSKDDVPWAATVMYAYDNDLNIYFLSKTETRKVQNILANSKVAATINEITGGIGKVKGVQLEGECQIVSKLEAVVVYVLFLKRFFWLKDHIPSVGEMFSKLIQDRLFKITPERIYYLDDELFGLQGREMLVVQ